MKAPPEADATNDVGEAERAAVAEALAAALAAPTHGAGAS